MPWFQLLSPMNLWPFLRGGKAVAPRQVSVKKEVVKIDNSFFNFPISSLIFLPFSFWES